MSLIPYLTPEQEELAKVRRELRQSDQVMIEKELELETLQAEQDGFRHLYHHRIAMPLLELDEIEAQIAEFRYSLNPKDQNIKELALAARAKATVSRQTYASNEVDQVEEFKPSKTLKSLFRKAAKLSHPDRSKNPEDKKYREKLMAMINSAYKANDEVRLRSILRKLISNVHILEETDIQTQIADTCSQIDQVKNRIKEISESKELQESSLNIHRIPCF